MIIMLIMRYKLIKISKNINMIIIAKKQRMLKIYDIVKS